MSIKCDNRTIIVGHASEIIERPNKVNFERAETGNVLFINQKITEISIAWFLCIVPEKLPSCSTWNNESSLCLNEKLNLKCMFTLNTSCQLSLRNIPSKLNRKKVLSSLNKLTWDFFLSLRKDTRKFFSFALGTSFNCVRMPLSSEANEKVLRAAYSTFKNRIKIFWIRRAGV